jgi:Fe-S-cluster containining protein
MIEPPPHPCDVCRGACCQSFLVPLPRDPRPDVVRFLGLRGSIERGFLRVDRACDELSDDGRCNIYDRRPQPCREYKVSGPDCRRAVDLRRTSAEAQAIFDTMEAWALRRSSHSDDS